MHLELIAQMFIKVESVCNKSLKGTNYVIFLTCFVFPVNEANEANELKLLSSRTFF
jgi:hypothetical protein